MHLLLILVAGYVSIFLLGFQSLAVNHGNYRLAMGNSFLIAVAQTTVWGALFKDLSWAATFVYACGACLGIASSMFVHQKLLQKWRQPKQ